MARKVPGLTPQTEDRPSGRRNSGRVVTNGPGLRAPQLSPTARPVDTFARPERGPQTNGWMQLAESLSAVSPALQQMLGEQRDQAAKQAEDMANRRIGGMSFEEAQAAVRDGTISEMDNPWFKAAFMRQYGERLANHRANEIGRHYETEFDRDNGNLDAYIAEQMQGDLEAYGDNRFFVEAYGQRMGQFTTQANQRQTQHLTERARSDATQGVFENFLGETRNMLEAGALPEEVAQALRGQFAGNRDLLNVDYRAQDAELLRVAQTLAEDGRHDVVQALLGSSTTLADGTVLGPLQDNRDFAADSATVLTRAERNQFENTERATSAERMDFWDQSTVGRLDEDQFQAWHRAHPGAYTDAQVQDHIGRNRRVVAAAQEARDTLRTDLQRQEQSIRSHQRLEENDLQAVEDGMAPYLGDAVVLDERGNEKTIPAETRRENLATNIVDRIDAKVDAGEMTAEQGFASIVARLTPNGLTNPKWESVLEAGPIAAAPMTTTGGEVPPALQEGVDLYMRLHAQSPRLLQAHLRGNSRDFYESYRVAVQYGRLSPAQAMAVAQKQTEDPAGFEAGYFKPRQEEITAQVRSLQSNGFARLFGLGTPPATNEGYVANEMARLSQFYARNGVSSEQALKLAKERFQSTHSQVNGNWLYTADKSLPPNFAEVARGMLEDYVRDNPDEGHDLESLTIQPASNGTGAWMIVDHFGMPVENSETRTFTLRGMGERTQQREQERRQEVIGQTNAENEVRYDPWLVINENTFLGPWLGSDPSPEEQQRVRDRAREITEGRRATP